MRSPRTRTALLAAVAAASLAACGASTSKVAVTTTTAPTTTSTSAPSTTTATTAPATTTSTVATTTTSAPGVPPCATDGLAIAVGGPTDPGAGSVTYPITFTNKGSSACTLDGFPGVSAVNGAGQQIGQPATRTSQAPSVVVIQPGQSGTALLRSADAGNFDPGSCGTPTTSAGLRVYPPGQTAATTAPVSISVCPGAATQFQIQPVTS